jgi:hypothetical protein
MASPTTQKPIPFHQDPEFWRKQTYFLVLTSLVYLAVMMAPLGLYTGDKGGVAFTCMGYASTGDFSVEPLPMPGIVTGFLMMGAIFSLYTMMRFQPRKNQVALAKVKLMFSVAINALAWGIAFFWVKGAVAAQDPTITFEPGWGLYVLPLAVVLSFLSLRFVQSDMKKLRSAERFW